MSCRRLLLTALVSAGFWLAAVPVAAAEASPEALAASLKPAVANAERELAERRRELDQLYGHIAAAKQHLAQEGEALAKALRDSEAASAAAERQRDDDQQAAETLESERVRLRQLGHAIAAMSVDYRRALESRLAPAEVAAVEVPLGEFDAACGEAPDTLAAASLETLLQLSLDRCANAFGGRRSQGQTVDPSGTVLEGTFITVGPLSFFQSAAGVTGLAFQEVGSLRPTLYSAFSAEQHAALRTLFATGTARVPVDVTMGSGVQLEQARETLLEHLRKGGLVMVPLLALGLVCALIVFYKLIQVSRLATETCQARVLDVVAAITAGDMAAAERLTDSLRLPLRPVIREGLRHRHATREQLEEILYEQVLAQVPPLERFLGVLAVGTGAAPLLGLLGTVTGMIHTFRLITVFGTGDARLLSAGISEALITTEVGLTIAIPTLLCHAYLSRRVRRMVGMVQEAAAAFVNGVTQGVPPA